MNYRHSFHAGNHADVFKHALLVRLVRAFQRKDTGFLFLDTHAGRGCYDLSKAAEGDTRARQPEWPAGIGRLWEARGVPAEVEDYLALVRSFDRGRGNLTGQPRFYPGSPRIVRSLCREQDRMELWERHPAECAALRAEFEGERRVSVREDDGYGAIKACLPPRERRALVLVDPPYESTGEWDSVCAALGEGLGRLASATFAVWYPMTDRVRPEEFDGAIRALGAPCLAVELVVDPRREGMRGSGMLIVKPPWRFDEEAESIASYLGIALADAENALGSVRWIVSK